MFGAFITFSLADICIYCFIALFCLIGLAKGLVKIVFSMLQGITALVVSYFLTKPVSILISKFSFDEKISDKVFGLLTEKAPSLNNVIDLSNYEAQIIAATEEANLPNFIGKIISNALKINDSFEGMSLGRVLSTSIASMIITIISFILVLIVFSVIIMLLARLFEYLVSFGGLKTLDRLCGMILSGFGGLLLVSFILLVVAIIGSAIPSVNDVMNGFIYPNGYDNEGFSIASWLYDNNPLKFILQNLNLLDKINLK